MSPQPSNKGGPAIAGIAGMGIFGLGGWASLLYAAYQLGKGNKKQALAGLGAAVSAFFAARAVARAALQASVAEAKGTPPT